MPSHDLNDLRAAAVTPGRLMLGGKACYDRLLGKIDPKEGVFSTVPEAKAFAVDVLLALQPGDFCESLQIPDTSRRPATYGRIEDYDVYGVQLSAELLQKHGLTTESTWYVKLTLRKDANGNRLFCLSLHRLEHPMQRVSGWLRPAW